MSPSLFTVLLAGNPNSGKTSVFNLLCKTHQKVGNYPGVTVEKKVGRVYHQKDEFRVIDLPGTYSLKPSSLEEKIARKHLLEERDALILNIVDGTNLERNLYLSLQLMELGRPMILVVNMQDEMLGKGIVLNPDRLSKELGVPVILLSANKQKSRIPLIEEIIKNANKPHIAEPVPLNLNPTLLEERARLQTCLGSQTLPASFLALQILEDDPELSTMIKEEGLKSRERILEIYDENASVLIAEARYRLIQNLLDVCLAYTPVKKTYWDSLDSVLTAKTTGLPIFFLIVYLTFQMVFTLGDYPMGWIEAFFEWLKDHIIQIWPKSEDTWLKSLLIDGLIGGVGGVLVFLPNIVLLFIAIAFLDGTGYMARAAFLMDRVMKGFGLHGKSFMPLVSGLGCTVPSIMATRVLENQADRMITLMVLPMVSCTARLPIYGLLIPVFFPLEQRGFVLFCVYLVGIIILILSAKLLRMTMFRHNSSAFLMEIPPLRLPTLGFLWTEMLLRSKIYLKKAGSVILVCSLILWALGRYPRLEIVDPQLENRKENARMILTAELSKILPDPNLAPLLLKLEDLNQDYHEWEAGYENGILELQGTLADTVSEIKTVASLKLILESSKTGDNAAPIWTDYQTELSEIANIQSNQELLHSFAGRIGTFFAPVFAPIGFDWKIVTALIGAIAAKEVFVTQFSIIYGMGSDIDTDSLTDLNQSETSLSKALKEDRYLPGHPRAGEKVFSPLVAISLMIFCLISTPCMSTIAVTIRETNSYAWGLWQFAGFSILAYVLSFLIYQTGILMNLS